MILPNGTVETTKNGGEEAIRGMIKDIEERKINGYLHVLGSIQNADGAEEEVLGQLVFKDGEAKLCDIIISGNSNKGDKGIYPLFKSMMRDENTVELHTKVEVAPLIAFYKDSQLQKETTDMEKFFKRYEEELLDRQKKEEEMRRREEKLNEIKEAVDKWLSEGYVIPSYPAIMEGDFLQVESWYDNVLSNLKRITELREWASKLTDREIQGLKAQLFESTKRPEEIESIEKIVKEMEGQLSVINEKREEMKKWVDLWNSEGYNTLELEEALKGNVESAWNSLTTFMDQIQVLKDLGGELKELSEAEDAAGFESEVREIEFLVNDPAEIPSIRNLIKKLRETIKEEKEGKAKILSDAKEIAQKGFTYKVIEDGMNRRYHAILNEFLVFKNNSSRILDIRTELEGMDRRDIPDDIDRLKDGSKDPFKLDEYESALLEIQDKITNFNEERTAITNELKKYGEEGFITSSVDDLENEMIGRFRDGFNDFLKKVEELQNLKSEIDSMDKRWLESEYQEIEGKLTDPALLDDIKSGIKKLEDTIKHRESERERIRSDMNGWIEEGFAVDKLKEVIEEDLPAFTAIYDELKEKISEARGKLSELDKIDISYFPLDAQEVRAKLQDPYQLESGTSLLAALKENVDDDRKVRNALKARFKDLEGEGWNLDGITDLFNTKPADLKDRIDEFEGRVNKIIECEQEISGWDTLETGLLAKGMDELKRHLRDLGDYGGALTHFDELKSRVSDNARIREDIRNKIAEWNDLGYITDSVDSKIKGSIDKLSDLFDDLKGRIGRLEGFQNTFDGLNTKFFRSDAEDIEFKLNDPALVEEIESELNELTARINEDESRRLDFKNKIDDYMKNGFTGAEKLYPVLEEDISIVELEFRNFEKEVSMLKKYMESTGFSLNKDKAASSAEATEEQAIVDNIKDMDIPDDLTFDNYIIGESNKFASKAAESVVENPAKAYNPLFIFSGPGMGKTHLMSSIGNRLKSSNPDMNLIYLTTEKFTNDLVKAISDDNVDGFRYHYRNADVLLMDDIEYISGKDQTQEEFFNTFNDLHSSGKQIVLTSDRPPKDIPKLSDRLKSRFEGGLVVDISSPSPETKEAIVNKMASRAGIILPDGAGRRIADAVDTDLRALKGVVQKLESRVNIEGADIDYDLVSSVIKDITGKEEETKEETSKEESKEEEKAEEPDEGGSEEGGEEDETVLCTNCGESIAADADSCTFCGASFEGEVYECPRCHAEVPDGTDKCPGCGAVFQLD
ncbi:MAG: DnaA ATPase domain-containing protein [Thermoplasmatota archaeon]